MGTYQAGALDREALIRLMVGREPGALFPKRSVPLGEVVLELAHVANRDAGVRDVSLSVRAGEILGLAGLAGCRRSELAETIFGLTPADAGEIRIRRRPRCGTTRRARRFDPASATCRRTGAGTVSSRRCRSPKTSRWRACRGSPAVDWSSAASRATIAGDFISRLRIKAPSSDTGVAALSGGNQQKVALARWLMTGARVLILDEPTQGVDVGAKAEIHALIMDLAEQGAAILMISSELPELLGMSDRIAVMHDGTIAGVLARSEASAPAVLADGAGPLMRERRERSLIVALVLLAGVLAVAVARLLLARQPDRPAARQHPGADRRAGRDDRHRERRDRHLRRSRCSRSARSSPALCRKPAFRCRR